MANKLTKTTVDGIDLITILRPGVKQSVMLLHGFGAGYEDLAPLASYLDSKDEWNWIFPNGILEVPLGPHMSGRAWFPIRMADIEAAAMRGLSYDFSDVLPEGMKFAEQRLISLIEHLRIDPKDLVLGGFSQGAMMTLQVGLHLEESLRGMILFSGTLINRKEWLEKLPNKIAIPFMQSHGRSDPVLGFQHAERLYGVLKDAGLKGDFHSFHGHHEIPFPTIQKASAFLQSLRS